MFWIIIIAVIGFIIWKNNKSLHQTVSTDSTDYQNDYYEFASRNQEVAQQIVKEILQAIKGGNRKEPLDRIGIYYYKVEFAYGTVTDDYISFKSLGYGELDTSKKKRLFARMIKENIERVYPDENWTMRELYERDNRLKLESVQILREQPPTSPLKSF